MMLSSLYSIKGPWKEEDEEKKKLKHTWTSHVKSKNNSKKEFNYHC